MNGTYRHCQRSILILGAKKQYLIPETIDNQVLLIFMGFWKLHMLIYSIL